METSTPLQNKKPTLKNKVEAILFSVGKRISLQEITKLARSKEDTVLAALAELQKHYAEKDSSLTLTNDGEFWKLAIHDHYIPTVKKIVTETELTKTVLETLAIIAFKYPIKQSDLIAIRTNKAYDHLRELEKQGFISRKKHGRTNLIKLTDKFFQYFDLPADKLREHFNDFESMAQAITKKEIELHERNAQRKQELENLSSKEDRIKQEIEGLGVEKQEGAIETYEVPAEAQKEPTKLGTLEVYAEDEQTGARRPPEENPTVAAEEKKEQSSPQQKQADSQSISIEGATEQMPKETTEEGDEGKGGIHLTKEQEREVEKKIEGILHPHTEEDEQEPTTQIEEDTQSKP